MTNRFWNLKELTDRLCFVKEVIFLHNKGLSLSEIQEKLKFHCRQTIHNIIKSNMVESKIKHETGMPHCWCNPDKQVFPNGNMHIVHRNEDKELVDSVNFRTGKITTASEKEQMLKPFNPTN